MYQSFIADFVYPAVAARRTTSSLDRLLARVPAQSEETVCSLERFCVLSGDTACPSLERHGDVSNARNAMRWFCPFGLRLDIHTRMVILNGLTHWSVKTTVSGRTTVSSVPEFHVVSHFASLQLTSSNLAGN